MATPSENMVGVSAESSSSEDEDLEKFKEAVWTTQGTKAKDTESNGNHSRRISVSQHQHDGNELQVTPEFQAHVAKKLGHFLDGVISEVPAETLKSAESVKCDDEKDDDDDDDEGFRLFRTSIPGRYIVDDPPPVKRRPVQSSSDSDSEMESRLREAAVSISDLLPPSSRPGAHSSSSTEAPCMETAMNKKEKQQQGQGEEGGTVVPKTKKKKKKKKPQEDSGVVGKIEKGQEKEMEAETLVPQKKKRRKLDSEEGGDQLRKVSSEGCSEDGEPGGTQEESKPLKKRKKKKKRKATDGKTEGEALN